MALGVAYRLGAVMLEASENTDALTDSIRKLNIIILLLGQIGFINRCAGPQFWYFDVRRDNL